MTAGSRQVLIWTCAIVLTGAAARVAPLFHDFWLDEAWSYLMVRDLVVKPTDIITKLTIDNNHPLNSLAIFLLGADIDWPVYRLPAWIAGVVCIPLSFVVMRRFGTPHGFYAMVLVACSYPLIVYSAEARGYGTMLCCLLVAIEAAQRWLTARNWAACGTFWTAVVLGALSQLTFIHGYLAILAFSLHELRQQSARRADFWTAFLVCHGIPLPFLLVLYWGFVRHLDVGGAAPTGLIKTLIETVTMTLGGPNSGPLAMFYVLVFLAVLLVALHLMRTRSAGWHLLFVCGIVLVPAPVAVLRLLLDPMSTPLFPRYFLTSVLLFLLLAGFLLGELHVRGPRGKLGSAVLLTWLLAGNFVHSATFTLIGRGQYWLTLQQIVSESADSPIHIASNSDFRTSLLISFYRRYLPENREIIYHPRQELDNSQEIDWWIVEFLDTQQQPPQRLDIGIGHFSLQRHFDFYGPSGCGWAVYRRTPHSG